MCFACFCLLYDFVCCYFGCLFVCLFDGVIFFVLFLVLLTWVCCGSSVHRFDFFVYVVNLFVCLFLFWVFCVCLLLFVSELDAFVFFCLCSGLLLFTILFRLLFLFVCLFVCLFDGAFSFVLFLALLT